MDIIKYQTVGRPKIYSDPEELHRNVLEFIETIKASQETDKPIKPTVTKFALFLGFSSKDTLYQYSKQPEFSDSIKAGLTFIENAHEERLFESGSGGSIFALKNMGWKDNQEITHSVSKNYTEEELEEQLQEIRRLKKLDQAK